MKALKCGLIVFMLLFSFQVFAVESDEDINKKTSEGNMYKQLELFADVLTIIKEEYVENISSKDIIYGALKGMLSSLDMHSQFMTPDEYKEIKVETEGHFGGLGIVITMRDKILTVVSPLEGTPAQKAGVEAGDMIVGIDSASTKDLTLSEAVKKLRGEPGSKVTITVLREGESELLNFEIVRDIIKIQSVKDAKILQDNIGYVRLVDFQEDTAVQLDKAIKNLESQNMDALILDLRNNPGGLLNVAVEVSERFIPEGKLVVFTKGRKESQNFQFVSKNGVKYTKYPLVVLVNHGSASGSEIVAGAIQDYNAGIILGVKTFGKGSVQTVIPLADNSALKLTTSKYFTPSGRSIHGIGIEPDIIAEYEKIEFNKNEEGNLFENMLNGQEKEVSDMQDNLISDSQILKALDILKAIKVYNKDSVLQEKM